MVFLSFALSTLISINEPPIRCSGFMRALAVSVFLGRPSAELSFDDAKGIVKAVAYNRAMGEPWSALNPRQEVDILARLFQEPLKALREKWRWNPRHRFLERELLDAKFELHLTAAGVDLETMPEEFIADVTQTIISKISGIHLMSESAVNSIVSRIIVDHFGSEIGRQREFDQLHSLILSFWESLAEERVRYHETQYQLSVDELAAYLKNHIEQGWREFQLRRAEHQRTRPTVVKPAPVVIKEVRDVDAMILSIFEIIDPQYQAEFEKFFRDLPEDAQNALFHSVESYQRDPNAISKYVKKISHQDRRLRGETLFELKTSNAMQLRLVGRKVDGKLQLVSFGLRRDLDALVIQATNRIISQRSP